MLVIGDPLNVIVCAHFDPDNAPDLPCAIAEMQKNDRRFTIDVAERQPPPHLHA